jgi:NitT/TauT family transport system ATP-binding protein
MIKVENLDLVYDQEGIKTEVLKDISFDIQKGEGCAVIGPSGCGKTSLLFLLAGLLSPTAGEARVERAEIALILQDFGLFPWKTVYDNIALGLVIRKEGKESIQNKVSGLIEEMGLSGFEDYYPGQLSGGMQQRVALARALAIEPEILLMDEPLSSLDALTRERLQNLILKVWKEKKVTTVLVTHSIEEAAFLGEKIIVLTERPGRILDIIENREMGDEFYRRTEGFFEICTRLREIIKGDDLDG